MIQQPPPPPPPSFKLEDDLFRQKLLQKYGSFQGSSTEEMSIKKQKIEDIDEKYMTEADGIGIIEEKDIDKTTHEQCGRCERWIPMDIIEYHNTSHSSRILDWMYLGSEINCNNLIELTTRTNISYILNAAYESPNYYPDQFKYIHLDLYDVVGADIRPYFDRCFDFIEECRMNNKNILIHCIQGISRSATIVIMYLMKSLKYTLHQAYHMVKTKRTIIKPNPSFVQALIELELQLFGVNTITPKEMNKLCMNDE